MQNVLVFDGVGAVVRHWFEVGRDSEEHGARVELRCVERVDAGASPFAAPRYVVGRPVLRADLFDIWGDAPGNMSRAHFHSRFDGAEPGEREWDEELTRAPFDWLGERLRATSDLWTAAGLEPGEAARAAESVRQLVEPVVALARLNAGAQCRTSEQCLKLTGDTTREVGEMMAIYRGGASDPRLATAGSGGL